MENIKIEEKTEPSNTPSPSEQKITYVFKSRSTVYGGVFIDYFFKEHSFSKIKSSRHYNIFLLCFSVRLYIISTFYYNQQLNNKYLLIERRINGTAINKIFKEDAVIIEPFEIQFTEGTIKNEKVD